MSEVRNERLFGCVEVDVRVPDHLKVKFSLVKCDPSSRTQISAAPILETSRKLMLRSITSWLSHDAV